MKTEALSLYEINQLLRSVIEGALPETFLITAEISSFNVSKHCYLTLIDKDGDITRAKMDAVIWASKYMTIAPEFRASAGVELAKGIRILFEASVSFHEVYGLKLNIINIYPSYTIGEMASKRREILERLIREGLKERNRALEFPLVPQRIGIISSPKAAGYEDLITHLRENPYGYKFNCKLYEAVMQGERAEFSILDAIERCRCDSSLLDVVVIVRGGGGEFDLRCFDSYEIAKAMANLPVPVISGIGHERDVTVVDEVSNKRGKTPTAVADLIITRVKDYEDAIGLLSHRLVHGANKLNSDLAENLRYLTKGIIYSLKLLGMQKERILENAVRLKSLTSKEILVKFNDLDAIFSRVRVSSERSLLWADKMLRGLENNLNHLNPQNVLKRGYSITYSNDKAVTSVSAIKKGESLRTFLYKGEIISIVESATNDTGV
ncbi:MAG: putative exodeoxyribonuclease large subunit [Nitrospirae bacterium]|nr:putative exodeoxyribonuclease large subunit [Nitrospirota bacterium]